LLRKKDFVLSTDSATVLQRPLDVAASQTTKTLLSYIQYFTKPPRRTQPPTLSGMRNEYQPKCSDALQLVSKGRYGSFDLWINLWVAGTRRPASADRTARHQFQATGQPVSRTQASDTMTSWLPRYDVKCVQRRCFQWGLVPLRSDIKGMELPPANILIPLESN